jgi:hypothetical protein
MMKPRTILRTAASVIAVTALAISTTSAQTLLINYNFDEASGDAIDHGTAGANGTLVENATRTPTGMGVAGMGRALDLTATSGLRYVTAGEVPALDGLQAFTLTTWLNLQSAPTGNLRLLANQEATTFDGFSWNIADSAAGGTRTASNFGVRLFVGGSTAFAFDTAAVTLDADDRWLFLAVSYDGSSTSNNVNYYVGDETGAVFLAATTTINAGTLNPAARFNVGHTDAAITANTAPPGYLDDSRVYSGVLDLAQLEAVRLAAIPEPSTYAVIFGGLALLVVAGRRFRARRS